MPYYEQEFPFEEIKDYEGDYFLSIEHLLVKGYTPNQIWSVVEADDNVFIYGPMHHYVNLIGYIATKEYHNMNTYYCESFSLDE